MDISYMTNGSMSGYNNGTFTFFDFPLYMSYTKLFIYLVLLPVVFIPTLMVTSAIIKSKELSSKPHFFSSFFLINLYVGNMMGTLMRCGIGSILLIIYVLGVSINYHCIISNAIHLVTNASKILFLPLAIDRFLSVAYPFSYKRIMTMQLATGLVLIPWVLSMMLRISALLTITYVYYPPLGDCTITGGVAGNPILFLLPITEILATVMIIATSMYLRQKIIKSNKLFRIPRGNAADERKATRAGKLLEVLEEQLKPTMSVLIVGGIDGLFDLLNPIIYFVTVVINPAALEYVIEFVLIPLSFFQMLSHVLTYGMYNKNIRKEVCGYKEICSKESKVVTLNRNNN